MAEFDFAPRPPKQTDQTADSKAFAAGDPQQDDTKRGGGKAPGQGGDRKAALAAALRNPAESGGMLSGLLSMATTLGLARHTAEHVEPINSPSGLMGLLKGSMSMLGKQEQSDEHKFDLDLTRQGTSGGGIGGMNTGLGMVGGPVQAASRKEATTTAMKALGGLSRTMGGGLNSTIGSAGAHARNQMQWLSEGVRRLYKLER